MSDFKNGQEAPNTSQLSASNPAAILDSDPEQNTSKHRDTELSSFCNTDPQQSVCSPCQAANDSSHIASAVCKPRKNVRQRLWTTLLSTVVACIPFLLIGCTLGFPSGALLDLTDLEERPEFKLTRQQADVFGALGYIGAGLGGPIAGWISDRMGRKPALMLVSLPYLTGYMMITYAHFAVDPVLFKVFLFIGRFFSGIALGWSSLVVVVYVAEISPAKLRGRIGSVLQIFLALGVVVTYALSSFDSFRYYNSSLVLIGFVTLFTMSMVFFSETPRWLLTHGQKERAVAALKFLRGPKYNISREVSSIQANFESAPKLNARQALKEFTKGNVIVPMILCLMLGVFLQCGGLNSVIAYSALILRNAGVPSFRQIALYGTGCTRLALNIVALFLTDLFGRKVLLIISSIGTFMGTTMLGVHFYITNPSFCSSPINSTNTSISTNEVLCNPQYAPLAITGIVVYNVGFSIGWGPVFWLLLGELLPLQIKGIGTGIVTFTMWGLTSIVVGTYLSFTEATRASTVWWIYSVVNFTSLLFVGVCLFETKGKSLEDIQRRFEKKYGK